MDWIQENKFVSGLLGVTIMFAGAIFYHGYSEGDEFASNMEEYGQLRSKYHTLVNAKPYPNQANLTAREKNVLEYEAVIKEVRDAFFEYKPDKLPKLTPGEFSDARIKMQSELRKAFSKAGTSLPDKCAFGFEKYTSKQAAPYATKKLNYQLGAIQWLLEKLAESEPRALLNVKREILRIEKEAPPVPSKKKNTRGRAASAEQQQILETMPVELTFIASESSMRDFLRAMANSKEYLYATRALRIRNENQNAPGPKDAVFQVSRENAGGIDSTPFEENDVFGQFAIPGEVFEEEGTSADTEEGDNQLEPQKAPELNDEHILKQVMGDENLIVHIKFDILFMKGDKPSENKLDNSTNGQSQDQ